jgi:hypothetical protein
MYRYHTHHRSRLALAGDDLAAICYLYPAGLKTPPCKVDEIQSIHVAGFRFSLLSLEVPGFLSLVAFAVLLWRVRIRLGRA